MIDVTRAVQLGWVEDCGTCRAAREALDLLWKEARAARRGESRCRPTGLDQVKVVCEDCDSRGWALTNDGAALIDLAKELYPEIVSARVAEEMPF